MYRLVSRQVSRHPTVTSRALASRGFSKKSDEDNDLPLGHDLYKYDPKDETLANLSEEEKIVRAFRETQVALDLPAGKYSSIYRQVLSGKRASENMNFERNIEDLQDMQFGEFSEAQMHSLLEEAVTLKDTTPYRVPLLLEAHKTKTEAANAQNKHGKSEPEPVASKGRVTAKKAPLNGREFGQKGVSEEHLKQMKTAAATDAMGRLASDHPDPLQDGSDFRAVSAIDQGKSALFKKVLRRMEKFNESDLKKSKRGIEYDRADLNPTAEDTYKRLSSMDEVFDFNARNAEIDRLSNSELFLAGKLDHITAQQEGRDRNDPDLPYFNALRDTRREHEGVTDASLEPFMEGYNYFTGKDTTEHDKLDALRDSDDDSLIGQEDQLKRDTEWLEGKPKVENLLQNEQMARPEVLRERRQEPYDDLAGLKALGYHLGNLRRSPPEAIKDDEAQDGKAHVGTYAAGENALYPAEAKISMLDDSSEEEDEGFPLDLDQNRKENLADTQKLKTEFQSGGRAAHRGAKEEELPGDAKELWWDEAQNMPQARYANESVKDAQPVWEHYTRFDDPLKPQADALEKYQTDKYGAERSTLWWGAAAQLHGEEHIEKFWRGYNDQTDLDELPFRLQHDVDNDYVYKDEDEAKLLSVLDPTQLDQRNQDRYTTTALPSTPLSDRVKFTMWVLHKKDPAKWHPRSLAQLFKLSVDRTQAILLLKSVEERTRELGLPVFDDFDDDHSWGPMNDDNVSDSDSEIPGEGSESSDMYWADTIWDPNPMAHVKNGPEFTFADDNEILDIYEKERKRDNRLRERGEKMGVLEGEHFGRYGHIGARKTYKKPEKLDQSVTHSNRHHWIFTDISDKKNTNYSIAVRDKKGTLRTPTAKEFNMVRKMEKAATQPFFYVKYRKHFPEDTLSSQ